MLVAQSDRLFYTTVQGRGLSKDDAMKDAISWAIQLSVETMVVDQTLFAEVLRERIMTYEISKPMTKMYGGFFEVEINAVVDREQLQRKLAAHKIVSYKDAEKRGNADAMISEIENAIRKIDVEGYLKFVAAGANKEVGNDAKLYIKRNGNYVEVSIGLLCMFDDKRFQQEVTPKLQKLFDSLPFGGKHEVVINETNQILFAFEDSDPIAPYTVMDPCPASWCYRDTIINGSPTCILLNADPKFRPQCACFMCYHFPRELDYLSANRMFKLLRDKRREIKMFASLYLLDAHGNEISRITQDICDFENRRKKEFTLGGRSRCQMYNLVFHKALDSSETMIAPAFFVQTDSFRILTNPVFILPVSGRVWLGDFEKVRSYRLVIENPKKAPKTIAEGKVSVGR